MVSEPPTPKCVGREFVRQYYTVLNKAPQQLHRFYSSTSSFVHGKDNHIAENIVGQSEIHKYIKQLDFNDCHAKILLIDSQETLANGVVIQVTGELSNNGGPMRRFMQTFVLGAQAENKYYVHNDIFRYHDQVFDDPDMSDEAPEDAHHDNGIPDMMQSPTQSMEQPLQQQPVVPVAPAATGTGSQPAEYGVVMQHVVLNQQVAGTGASQPQMNGRDLVSPQEHDAPQVASPQQQMVPQALQTSPVAVAPRVSSQPEMENGSVSCLEKVLPPVESATVGETRATSLPPQETEKTTKPTQKITPEPATPRTFSALFKNTKTSHSSVTEQEKPPQKSAMPPPSRSVQTSGVHDKPTNRERTDSSGFQRPGRRAPQSHANNGYRSSRGVHFSESEVNASDENGAFTDNWRQDDRRRSGHPDAHQIFVGNMPQSMNEEDLRSLFQKYGSIIDVRINTGKTKPGGPGNGKPGAPVPNFGFITFEDVAAVKKCLNDKPITTHNEHRLNVEEKKARTKPDSGFSRQGGPRPMTGRGGFNRGIDGGRGPRGSFGGPPRR